MSSSNSERRVLHIVTDSSALPDALAFCRARDALLLVHAAVVCSLAADTGGAMSQARAAACFVLQPDLAARGLAGQSLHAGVQPIDDAGMVALVEKYDVSHTWYR